jgi:hypothetical protein
VPGLDRRRRRAPQALHDGDYAVFAFRRCIIFDAIDVGALAPDLAGYLGDAGFGPDSRRQGVA